MEISFAEPVALSAGHKVAAVVAKLVSQSV